MQKDNQAKKKKNEVINVTSSLECLEMASGNWRSLLRNQEE